MAFSIFIIEQGLTHPHKNNIGQFFFESSFRLLVDHDHLVIDLIKFQVAFAVHISCRAKFATQGTSDLRTDTSGLALISWYQYALYKMSIKSLETGLNCAVRAVLNRINESAGKLKSSDNFALSSLLRLVITSNRMLFLPYPFIDLARAEFLLSQSAKILFQLIITLVSNILLHFFIRVQR